MLNRILVFAALGLTSTLACSFDDDVFYNLCPGMKCISDMNCASGVCSKSTGYPTGRCKMEGWQIAVTVIVSIIVLASIIACCVCCCRRRKQAKLQRELQINNYYFDAQGRPLMPPQANAVPMPQGPINARTSANTYPDQNSSAAPHHYQPQPQVQPAQQQYYPQF